jgi:UDP-N-acetylglucosamine--N-acetylmuramyl-(pentapeptide) pyrophosphoryl-undecaprenol N-acetylglucosamine transferase
MGQQGGLEARLVPAEGGTFYGVRAGKWHRGRPDPRQALRAALGLTNAARCCARSARRWCGGFGGFASFPALAAARLLGVPTHSTSRTPIPARSRAGLRRRAFPRGGAARGGGAPARRSGSPKVTGVPVRETRVSQTRGATPARSA